MGDGFFDVDVFTGLEGGDADQGVRVIGSGDDDGIDVFVFEEPSVIDVCLDVLTESGGGCFVAFGGVIIGVAGGDEAAAFSIFEEAGGVATALAAGPDDGDADIAVGALGAEQWGPWDGSGSEGGGLEKAAAGGGGGGAGRGHG